MAKGDGKAGRAGDDRSDDTRRLRRLIKGVRVAMLTTVAQDGSLRSRPMQPVQRRFEGELWFVTSTGSHAALEVREHERVHVTFVDPDDDLYVAINGSGSLVTDRDKVRELWRPSLKAWFPRGKKDPSLGLLRVSVESAEYWDRKEARQVRLEGFGRRTAEKAPEAPPHTRRPETEGSGGQTGAQG